MKTIIVRPSRLTSRPIGAGRIKAFKPYAKYVEKISNGDIILVPKDDSVSRQRVLSILQLRKNWRDISWDILDKHDISVEV